MDERGRDLVTIGDLTVEFVEFDHPLVAREDIDDLYAAKNAGKSLTPDQADLNNQVARAHGKRMAILRAELRTDLNLPATEPLDEYEKELLAAVGRHHRRRQDADRRARLASQPREKYKREDIFERDRWICQICDLPVDRVARAPDPSTPSIDHIIPPGDPGGSDMPGNVRTTHLFCNMDRQLGDRTGGQARDRYHARLQRGKADERNPVD